MLDFVGNKLLSEFMESSSVKDYSTDIALLMQVVERVQDLGVQTYIIYYATTGTHSVVFEAPHDFKRSHNVRVLVSEQGHKYLPTLYRGCVEFARYLKKSKAFSIYVHNQLRHLPAGASNRQYNL